MSTTLRDLSVMTYDDCARMLGTRDRVKLANNTWLQESRYDIDAYGIVLHETEIVTVRSDDRWVLRARGWQTTTTKQRLNALTPASIYQMRHVWYVSVSGDDDVEFFDGIEVDRHGDVRMAPDDVDDDAGSDDFFITASGC